MTTAPPACPRCRAPVQPDWDWCQSCGYDPDGIRSDAGAPSPVAPGSRVPPPPPPTPHLDDFGTAPRRDPGPPRRHSAAGTVIKVVVVVVVAAVAVGAVAVVVLRSGDKSTPAATPAFQSGLTTFFSTSSPGANPIVLPDDLPGCVQQKLDADEVAQISALHRPADSDRLANRTGIDTYRAVRDCDLAGAAEVLTAEKDVFTDFGVHDISQQECVMQHMISTIAALPDTTTGSMDAHITAAVQTSFAACVPVSVALTAVVAGGLHAPADVAACIGDHMAPTITWADLFVVKSAAGKAKYEAALKAALNACH